MEPTLIALHGARGAGKDTTYQFIQDWCVGSDPALSAVRGSFADRMKWAYMRMWVPDCTMKWAIDFIDRRKNDNRAAVHGYIIDHDLKIEFIRPVNFRDHMNQFATESAREVYGNDHWVDQVLPLEPTDRNPEGWRGNFLVPPRSAEEDPYSFAHFAVITDLRAENEMDRIKHLGGICVKIQRKDAEDKERLYYEQKGIDRHLFASELDDDLFDVILVNDDNDMDKSKERTVRMMEAILDEGIGYVAAVSATPWRIA